MTTTPAASVVTSLFCPNAMPTVAKGWKGGEIAAKAVVQLLFSIGKSFTVDGLREKLRGFLRQEVRAECGPWRRLATWS